MKARLFLAGALVFGLAGTAMADEYYIVKSPKTHHCTITTTKPAGQEVVTQIGPLAFKTREAAQDRITQTKVCSEDTTGSGNSTTIIKQR
jgi:hypothetical protein